MVRTHIRLFLFIACAFFHILKAQQQFLFSSFFAEKNLSSLSINCLFRDSRGHMWIGTEDGLNYFNGKTVRVFKHDYLDSNSLSDNVIVSVCEDRDGYIWIGTGHGIGRLDMRRLSFENFYNDGMAQPLSYKQKVYIDAEDNIWSTGQNAIYRLNKADGAFEKIPVSGKSGLVNHAVPRLFSGIFQDSEKRYWVSSSDHLYRFFPGDHHFEVFPSPQNMLFQTVNEDERHNLYCGTWDDGLYKINVAANRLEPIISKGLSSAYVSQRLNGETLLWYGNKLSTYNLDDHAITHYMHDDANAYSARHSDVTALCLDAQNQLWIGYGTGLQILSPSNQNFKTYLLSHNENDFPTVNCLIKRERYDYAAGWHNYSLAKLDKDHKPLKVWKTLLPGVYETGNNISDAWPDGHGNIWFAGWPGLICFNEAAEKAQLFKMDSAVSRRSNFLQIVAEGDSVLWIAGYFCGLSRFSLHTHTFRNWGAHNRDLYWRIAKDNSGMLWLANNSGLLTGFDPRTETFVQKRFDRLTEGAIYKYILFDSISNLLWIGTNNGLLRVDRKTFAPRLFTEKDNLPTNQVNALQFDPIHRLWIATNKGLCFYDPRQNVFKTFFSNNGLPDNVLTQLFSMQRGGELFIGCRNGFSVMKTGAVSSGTFVPLVSIDRIFESGKIIPLTIKSGVKTVGLNYGQDNIRIEASFNDLINSEDNQLLFRLEGHDDEWHTTPDGIITYNKLAPGTYLLHVTAISHAGIKSKRGDYLAILVRPPFYKTTWFIALTLLGLLGLTVLIARYVFTRNLREKILILEKEQAIEKERSRISQDMHDELGSGLTKISIMSEVAMLQITDPLKAKQQLESISNSSRGLVDNLQDIIWILNSRNDSLENLCAYIQEYALKYFELFDAELSTSFPEKIPDVKLSEDQRRNILLVFKESFNNIIKHSGCHTISVAMHMQNGQAAFCITDNGKGFDRAAIRHFANGLHNMEKRMSAIQGYFKISSTPGQGTATEFGFRA